MSADNIETTILAFLSVLPGITAQDIAESSGIRVLGFFFIGDIEQVEIALTRLEQQGKIRMKEGSRNEALGHGGRWFLTGETKASAKLAHVTSHTRARQDGTRIQCPCCNFEMFVYHFAWSALVCSDCSAEVKKLDWRLPNKMAANSYMVLVGNVGQVHQGERYADAEMAFQDYCRRSKDGQGRAAGESVTMFRKGEPIQEYEGAAKDEQHS